MTKNKYAVSRINLNYAVVQFFYYAGLCTLVGFSTVFLSYRGINNAQIGLLYSAFGILSILLQIFISNFSDHHSSIPIKHILSLQYGIAIICCLCLLTIPAHIAVVVALFLLAEAFHASAPGLINAIAMQYVNAGVPVAYGWPRGFGSIGYALCASLLGLVVQRYSPNALLPIYIGVVSISGISVMAMPNPNRLPDYCYAGAPAELREEKTEEPATSYKEMLSINPTLVVFLCACILSAVGQSANMTFLIRIVESVGGGTREMGIGMLIQSGSELPMMLLSAWTLKRFKSKYILLFSFFCFFIKSLLIALANSLGFLYIALAVSMFCYGLFGFSSVYFVNGIVKPSEKVRAQSLVTLCYNKGLGTIIGNLYSGLVIDAWGLKTMLTIDWVISLAAALVMLFCTRLHTRHFE